MQEWMRWEPVKAKRFSSLLLTPARVVVAIGAACAMLPWAEGVAPGHRGFEPVLCSGLAAPVTASCSSRWRSALGR